VSGFVGEDDFESLKGIAEAKGPILFPGVLAGWDAEDKAMKVIEGAQSNGKQTVFKTVYHIKTKVLSAVVCRHFATRVHAAIDKYEEKDGVHHFHLENKPEEAINVEDWKKKKDAPPVADEPKTEGEGDEKKEEDEKKEDDAPKEEAAAE